MKRLLFIVAATVLAAPTFAQKNNVKKVKNKVEYASTPINYDFSNLEAEKVQELKDLIEPALTDPESKDMVDAWKYACRLKIYDMNQLLAVYQANNNTFPDPNAFFQNQYDVVTYYETYHRLMNTPNEKGKLPYKEEEIQKETITAQTAAKGARANLLIAASNLVYNNPAEAVKMLDLYYESVRNPLFADLNLAETDPNLSTGYYIYAVALKQTGGDEATYLEYLEKSLDTDNGAQACQDLVTYYKEKGNKEKELEYLALGTEKFPEQVVFHINLIQQELLNHNYDKAIELSDKAISNIETGVAPSVNSNGEAIESNKWPYYFKAVAYYNQEKIEDAYNAFVRAGEVDDNFDNLSGAANCAAQLGIRTSDQKEVSKQWYNTAIELYSRCETEYPDKSDVWGYQLYVCYNNTGNTAKAKEYEKYKSK